MTSGRQRASNFRRHGQELISKPWGGYRRMTHFLVGWLVHWLVSWLVGCLVDTLGCCGLLYQTILYDCGEYGESCTVGYGRIP